MIIEEKFYTISESELFSLCRYFITRDQNDLIIDVYHKIQQLVTQERISQLKFNISINNNND
jgi:hypothetical protein